MKKKTKKCDYCNKSVDKPYVLTIVPTVRSYYEIKPYNKKAPKIKRTDLTGSNKVNVYHFCNKDCSIEHSTYER
jgi:hypothetical protein